MAAAQMCRALLSALEDLERALEVHLRCCELVG